MEYRPTDRNRGPVALAAELDVAYYAHHRSRLVRRSRSTFPAAPAAPTGRTKILFRGGFIEDHHRLRRFGVGLNSRPVLTGMPSDRKYCGVIGEYKKCRRAFSFSIGWPSTLLNTVRAVPLRNGTCVPAAADGHRDGAGRAINPRKSGRGPAADTAQPASHRKRAAARNPDHAR